MPEEAKTAGERAFSEYLAHLGLKADYEVPAGGKNPDYLVHAPSGLVVCEVEDFGEGNYDKEIEDQLRKTGHSEGSWAERYKRIRIKIECAADQMRPYKGMHPCAVILFNTRSMTLDLNTSSLWGSMYGDLVIDLPVGSPKVIGDTRDTVRTDSRSAKLRANQLTTVSAVGVLERFRPNDHLVKREMDSVRQEMKEEGLGDNRHLRDAMPLVMMRLQSKSPGLIIDLEVIRVRYYHNVHAAVSLDPSSFRNQHDEHWALNPKTSRFERLPFPAT